MGEEGGDAGKESGGLGDLELRRSCVGRSCQHRRLVAQAEYMDAALQHERYTLQGQLDSFLLHCISAGKVELKRIDNKISRQVTFDKRRNGLLKKAY